MFFGITLYSYLYTNQISHIKTCDEIVLEFRKKKSVKNNKFNLKLKFIKDYVF